MSFLRRQRSQPINNDKKSKRYTFSDALTHQSLFNGPHTNLTNKQSSPYSTGLIRRVSSIFVKKKKQPDARPRQFHDSSSPSVTSSYAEDIRRPSGLGQRTDSDRSLPLANPDPPVVFKERSRCISTPELSTQKATDWDTFDVELKFSARTKSSIAFPELPGEVLELVLSFLSRQDLTNLACVSRRLSSVAFVALYTVLDFRGLKLSSIKKLLTILATKQRRLDIVRTLICRSWPRTNSSRIDPRTRSITPPSSTSTFAAALSNMRHVTSLTLPSFEIDLLRHAGFRLHHLTFQSQQLSREDCQELFLWLSTQPDLMSLSFPNLFDASVAPFTASEVLLANHATPGASPVSISHSPSMPVILPPLESLNSSHILPSLAKLHASPAVVSLVVPMRSMTDVTVNIESTLYTGLRPSSLIGLLKGVTNVGLKFGDRMDKRSVEKTLRAVGAVLGDCISREENQLQRLAIEIADDGDDLGETIHKAIYTILPRFKALHTIRLVTRSSSRVPTTPVSPAPSSPIDTHRPKHFRSLTVYSFPMASNLPAPAPMDMVYPYFSDGSHSEFGAQIQGELALVETWTKLCPSLRTVVFSTGRRWRMERPNGQCRRR